jgi:hypothetical protein
MATRFKCPRCEEIHPVCDHHQPKENPRLDIALKEAEQWGTAVSSVNDDRGMASVMLMWQPYECVWIASCSWSDSSEIKTHSESPVEAIDQLIDALAVEYRESRPSSS